MTRPVAVDLFAGGARGWDIHDEELGIETIGVESDETACATSKAAGLLTVHADVRKLSPVDVGFVGGKFSPPCQTFSAAGKGAGRLALEAVYGGMDHLHQTGRIDYDVFSDVRTGLVLEPLRWALDLVRAGQPFRWLVMEQVPPVLPVWERMGKVLESVGYSVVTGNLHAEQYGVPQTRKRAVLIARLDAEARMPVPTHSKYYSRNPAKLDPGVRKWVSMAEALGWDSDEIVGFARRADSDDIVTIDGVNYRDLRTADRPAFNLTEKARSWVRTPTHLRPTTMANASVRPVDRPAPTVAFGNDAASFKWLYRNGSHEHAALRPVDAPAPTVHFGARSNKVDWVYERPATTVQGDPRLAAPGHRCMTADCHADREPESMMAQAVRVTVQEAAVLQSLPADHPWQGSKTKQYLQVGNAIPGLLAKAILQQVL